MIFNTINAIRRKLIVAFLIQLAAALLVFISASAVFANDKETAKTPPKSEKQTSGSSSCVYHPSKEQFDKMNQLISPYHLGDDLDKTWKFACVENIDKQNVVFSLISKKTHKRLFMWLTSAENPTAADRKTANFNIVFVQEDRTGVDWWARRTAEKVADIINKNDSKKNQWRLEDFDKAKKDFVVGVTQGQNYKEKQKNNPISWRTIFVIVIPVIFVGVIIVRGLIKRLRSSRTREKNPIT